MSSSSWKNYEAAWEGNRSQVDGLKTVVIYPGSGCYAGQAKFDWASPELVGHSRDACWSSYQNFLYPVGDDRQGIENRRVCEVLERLGDRLLAEWEIDQWADFGKPDQRDALIEQAVQLGFGLRCLPAVEYKGRYCAPGFAVVLQWAMVLCVNPRRMCKPVRQ